MRKMIVWMMLLSVMAWMSGCATPASKAKNLRLGMMSEEVMERIGEPFTIRAAKVYENEEQEEIWTYIRPWWMVLSMSPESMWIHFVDGKVVQWGKPGDFAGKAGMDVPVEQYEPQRD